MKSVLVIGEDTRSFLTVIRSLGKKGYKVDVVCFDRQSAALASKYINKTFFYNYQAFDNKQWLDAVTSIAKENNYSLIIPCDERSIFPLAENQDKFPKQTQLAIPNQSVIEHLFDKYTTKKLAAKLNVPHARGEMMSLKGLSFDSLKEMFGDKFVIKPTLSFEASQLSKRQKVEIIVSKKQYIEWSKHANFDQNYLVESYFEGKGEGVSVLAKNGKVLAYFAHTRVNEPLSGGGSSYRKSIKVKPDMADACRKICEETNYTGVGMFEFKYNLQTREWILVEVNARFWGSVPLAVYAGVDFPSLLADTLLNIDANTEVISDRHYKVGVHARSLTNDIFDIKKEFEIFSSVGRKKDGGYQSIKRLARFPLGLVGIEKIDSLEFNDYRPFTKEVSNFYQSVLESKVTKLISLADRSFSHRALVQRQKLKQLYVLICRNIISPNVKFVCYGNIMRSPFAAKYLEALCSEVDFNWNIDSYGFHQNEHRKSPQECIDVSQTLGIDLENHRSKWLKQSDILPTDIIFIFDELNEDKITRYYDAPNVFNLTDFIPVGMGNYNQIDDPYGHGQQGVEQCYQLIAEAIKNIFEYMRMQTGTKNVQ